MALGHRGGGHAMSTGKWFDVGAFQKEIVLATASPASASSSLEAGPDENAPAREGAEANARR